MKSRVRNRTAVPLLGMALVICWLAGSPAPGDEPEMVSDRPDQTESPVVLPPGYVQLELGALYVRDDENGVRFEATEALGSLLRIGLSERLELRLGWAGYVSEESRIEGLRTDIEGAGDAELGAKIHLRGEAGTRPEIALLVASSVPVGDDELSSERFDPSFRLAFGHTLSDRAELGYNVGVAWTSDLTADGGRTTLSSYLYSMVLGLGLNERWGTFVELYGEVPGTAPGDPVLSFDTGLTCSVGPNLQLDVAAGLGLSEQADDWFVGVGLSVWFPKTR
ncbi:MAG: transporter [bacterium]|nr:transporter [bacterium]